MKSYLKKYRKEWIEALSLTFWHSFASLIPIFLGLLLFILFKQKLTLKAFSNNGEFAIYSASMIATSLYIIFKDYKTTNFKFRKLFGFISIFILLITSILYFSVTMINIIQLNILIYNRDLMRVLSFYLYILTVIITFIINGIDKQTTSLDIIGEQEKSLNELESDFDELGE